MNLAGPVWGCRRLCKVTFIWRRQSKGGGHNQIYLAIFFICGGTKYVGCGGNMYVLFII